MPGVYFTTTEFLDDAKSAAKDRGMPGIRMIALPADKYYRRARQQEELQPIADAVFDKMVDGAGAPADGGGSAADQIQKQHRKHEHQGDRERTIRTRTEKLNELFLDSHWADGLPIVPPTPDLVKAMLAGTTRSPEEVIGQVAPKNGTATVEKIAINSVMAGAKAGIFPGDSGGHGRLRRQAFRPDARAGVDRIVHSRRDREWAGREGIGFNSGHRDAGARMARQ